MRSVDQNVVSHSIVSVPERAGAPWQPPIEVAGGFAAQLEKLRRELGVYAAFLAQDRAAADDLVQEAFERAWVAQHRFQRGTSLRAWVTSILRNLFIDACRRNACRRRGESQVAWISLEDTEDILDFVSIDDVLEALEVLSLAEREVFTLAYLDHRPYRDISAHLGVPISTVGTRLLRVRAKLRHLLERVRDDRRVERRPGAM